MTFVDGELAATTRLNLGIGEDCVLPSMAVYPDVVAPRLKAGFVILGTTRLAANIRNFGIESGSRLSCDAFGLHGRGVLRHRPRGPTSPRLEHMAFYRRVLLFAQWCEPRPYPRLTRNSGCIESEFQDAQARIEARYSFYKSTPTEREAVFGPRGRELDLGFAP